MRAGVPGEVRRCQARAPLSYRSYSGAGSSSRWRWHIWQLVTPRARAAGSSASSTVRRQRLRVAPMVDRIVEHRLAPRVALQDVDQALGFDAVREDGDQAAEAAFAHVTDRALDLLDVERRLAAVELQVAVGGEGREGLVEDGGRVALVPALGRAVDRAPGAGPVAEVPFVEVQLAQLGVALGEVLDRS